MNLTDRKEPFKLDKAELQQLAHILVEIEWLLIALVIFYYVIPDSYIQNKYGFFASLMLYTVFVIVFHYTGLRRGHSPWQLALETWVMIAFITLVLWNTGRTESPLLNLYLLAIITSALKLKKSTTFFQVGLIVACYLYLGHSEATKGMFEPKFFSHFIEKIFPFILVAYLTTMLADNFRFEKDRIKLLSETDGLTGVLNLRGFEKSLEKAFARVSLYGRPLAVLMIDSDNLKHVNDSYGHDAGDRLIQHISKSIQHNVRASDIIARVGGDEFIVLLVDSNLDNAMALAERIRIHIETLMVDLDGVKLPATVSIGVSSFPEDSDDCRDLINKADQAMYNSKIRGRNCISAYCDLEASSFSQFQS